MRVIKTPEEIEGMEYALQLESAALISFYAQLENFTENQKVRVYEHDVPEMLNRMRREIARDQYLEMNSFPMILGSGPNGAIIHYRAEEG